MTWDTLIALGLVVLVMLFLIRLAFFDVRADRVDHRPLGLIRGT
jgi:hypothetical protein